jgi:hypothetical protein
MSARFVRFALVLVMSAAAMPATAVAGGLAHFVLSVPATQGANQRMAAARRAWTGPEQVFLAQSGCEFNCEEEPPSPNDEGIEAGPGAVNLSSANTDKIANKIAEANATCGSVILRKYRLDCLRVYYLNLAKSLPERGDYRPIRKALLDAAAKLDAIVTANVDPTEPRIRPRVRNKPAAPRMPPLRAVKPEVEARVFREAEKIVAETAIVILRSGEDPTRRTAHYQQIAEAVDSNLVILRSA